MQGIPLPNFHIVDGLSGGLGLNTATGPGGGLVALEKEILKAVDAAKGGAGAGRVVLVLDGLDFLIAAMGVTALEMGDVVGEVREVCCSYCHS